VQGCYHGDIIDVVTSWKWFTWNSGVAKWTWTCLGCSNWWTWKCDEHENVDFFSQSNVKFIITYIEALEGVWNFPKYTC
jgi:hypothetical protein